MKSQILKSAIAIAALNLTLNLGSTLALAEETSADQGATTKATASDLTQAAPAKDIDNEITNAKLRALSGSKSKWSFKGDLAYNGGSIEKPFADKRPNYAGVSNTFAKTSITGQLAIAYRLNPADALRLGVGMAINTPFQDTAQMLTNSAETKGRTSEVSNPFLDYSHSAKIGETQNITDASITGYTQDYYVNGIKAVTTLDVNQTVVYNINKLALGLNIDANYTFYKDSASSDDVSANPVDGRTDLTLAAFPYLEYSLTEKINLRTVFRGLTFDHYRSDSSSTYYQETYTQSFGLGYSLTRDIFLYPNVQFKPRTLSQDQTNIGLSATINL